MTRVLVVGLPRSGTSWTGRVVGKADGAVFVHEPDGEHEAFAIRAKRGFMRHLDVSPDVDLPDYERLWEGAFAGGHRIPNTRARVAERLFETATLAQRSAARRGEGAPLRLRVALSLAVPLGPVAGAEHVVVKSVHSSLSLEWVTRRFQPRVLVIERDARNVMASWMDLGMGGDKRENPMLAAYAKRVWNIAPPPDDAPKIVARTFVFAVLASALRDAAQRNPDWIVARHEDLCIDSAQRFGSLLPQLGLTLGDRALDYLAESDQAGAGFRTRRVTRDEPEKWKQRLSADDVARMTDELARFPHQLTFG